jgi:hypothetical protein
LIPRSRTIFLGLDSARANARDQSPEAFDFALSEVMDHEIVHALRNLDLWTQKEFSLLENAARKLKMPGTNKTFYQDAVERYVTQQPAGSKIEARFRLWKKRLLSWSGTRRRTER